MNCTQSQKMLDDYLNRELSIIQYSSIHSHLNSCEVCRTVFDRAEKLTLTLKNLPVPAARPGYEQRVLAFLENKSTQKNTTHNWFIAGFTSAIAATLAVWISISAISTNPADINHVNTVYLVAQQKHKVDLVFNLPSDLSNATLTIDLPEKVEIDGYPGKRQLQWKTSLTKGANRLALPLIARQQNNGFLIAQLTKNGKTRSFRVQIKTQQSPSSLLIQDNNVTNA